MLDIIAKLIMQTFPWANMDEILERDSRSEAASLLSNKKSAENKSSIKEIQSLLKKSLVSFSMKFSSHSEMQI